MCDVCGYEPDWLSAREETSVKKSRSDRRALPPQKRSRSARDTALPGVDPALREYLREWRRDMAKEKSTPAFVVMHDTTLDEICRLRPRSNADLLRVSGIGERKAELYGAQILAALAEYAKGARATAAAEAKVTPARETMRLLSEGRTIDEIAQLRGRQRSTVVSLVSDLVARGEVEFQTGWVGQEKEQLIQKACQELGTEKLAPLKEALPSEFMYDEIRLVVARLRWEADKAESD